METTKKEKKPVKTNKTGQIKSISIKVNWVQGLNMCLTLLENGNNEAKQLAKSELLRMAQLADLYVELRTKN